MKIIILGDIILDINNHCNTKRTAPEANIPIYNAFETTHILGGAANVAKNLKLLFSNDIVKLISVIGTDNTKIKSLLESHDIDNHLFFESNRKTTQKIRIFHDKKIITRYDIEDTHPISKEIEANIIDLVKKEEKPDLIIFSDYAKGLLTKTLCETIIDYANKLNIPTFVDPKPHDAIKYRDCFCLKVNLLEGVAVVNKNLDSISKKDIIQEIKQYINCKHLILTCAENGMYVDKIENHIIHKKKIDAVDVTGCGDTVLSVLAYMYLRNRDMIESAKVANYVAGKAVQTIGNYDVKYGDIDEFVDTVIMDTEKDKILSVGKMKNIVFTNGCFDLVHSAHMRLLQFSKKQGDVLVVGLNSDESIQRLKGPTRPINCLKERTEFLKNVGCIDYIIVFGDDTPLNILELLRPDIIVKGGDYTKDNIIGKEYAREVILYDFINGLSSTNTISKIIG